MARLEAVEKMLYYPTDLETIRLLVEKHLRIYGHSGYPLYILDPCVGEGLAVDTFRDALMGRVRQAADNKRVEIENYKNSASNYSWRINAYGEDYYLKSMQGDLANIESWLDNTIVQGVELDIQRAMAARELLGEKNVLESAFEYVQGVGKFNVLWMNPPYDQVNGRRAELTWIDMAAPMITEGGLIVLIVPDVFVGTGRQMKEMQSCLRHNSISDAMVLRFPDHSYPQFKQVAIIARKKSSSGGYYYSEVNLTVRGIIEQAQSGFDWSPCMVDIPPTLMKVEARTDLESVFSTNINKLKVLIGSPHSNGETIRPLIPMRPEHAAMMAAAGKFNGVIIEDKVIKGGTVKRVIHTEEARGKGAVISDKEVFAATISELSLDTGEIVTVNNLDNEEQFNETIRANAHELIEIANRMFPAQFLPEDVARYADQIARVRAPRKIKGHQNGLWDAQKYRAAAILHHWSQGNKVATMYGEMATGKTAVSMAATAIKASQRKPHNQKVIVLLPPKMDLIHKWEEEIKMSLRDFDVNVVHVETISDVRKAFAHEGLTYILLKETTAKMSSGWGPVIPKEPLCNKKYERPQRCPDCGHRLEYDNEDPAKEKAHCANEDCKTPLWTVTRRKSGKGEGDGYARYPLARYIRDHYRGRYILIIDEAHNMKAADSARGYAANDLLVSSECALQMTGTLYNGMASSIYYLLWRALPSFRDVWGWQDVQAFIDKYGLFEEITNVADTRWKSYSSKSGYREYTTRKNEKPGIHPLMIAELLPSTVFFALRDLEIEMPPYAEHTLFVDRPDEFREISHYLESIRSDAIEKMQKGDMSLLSQLTWAAQGAWDMASIGDEVDGHSLMPLDCPGDMWLKEEALLRLVAQEKRAGRKVLCFVGQINRRDNTGRLCELLEAYGMKGVVMRSEVTERLKFIRNALKDGADVIFTSAQLVKEGIDIIEMPTLVWMYGEVDTYLVQQANRRSWRPSQEQDVHIYYLAYNNTPQSERMYRLAKKVGAAQTLHGDVQQGLAALLGEQDFVSKLQDIVISTEHFESDLSIDDLPELETFEKPEVTVEVTVRAQKRTKVSVRISVEEIKDYSQMSLF